MVFERYVFILFYFIVKTQKICNFWWTFNLKSPSLFLNHFIWNLFLKFGPTSSSTNVITMCEIFSQNHARGDDISKLVWAPSKCRPRVDLKSHQSNQDFWHDTNTCILILNSQRPSKVLIKLIKMWFFK